MEEATRSSGKSTPEWDHFLCEGAMAPFSLPCKESYSIGMPEEASQQHQLSNLILDSHSFKPEK